MAASGFCPPRAETEEVEDHAEVEFSSPRRNYWKGEGDGGTILQKMKEDDDSSVATDDESSSSVLS